MDAATLSNLLFDLYDGIEHPESMQQFVNKLALSVHATGAAFREQFFDETGSVELKKASLFLTTGYSPESLIEYGEYFHAKDIYVQNVLQNHRHVQCATTDSIVPDSAGHRTEIYNDYQVRFDIGPMMWTKLVDQPSYVAAISFHRPILSAAFTAKELETLTTVTPHVCQVLRLSTRLRSLQIENGCLHQGLDEMDIALCIVRSDGTVSRMTPTAERLFSSGSGIRLRKGKLHVASNGEQKSLDGLIAGACCTGAGRGTTNPVGEQCKSVSGETIRAWTAPHGGALLVTRNSSQRPLQLIVTPFVSMSLLDAEAGAIVQISDPSAAPRSRSALLQALYLLTPTEARLADLLLQGHDVRQTAERMKITEATGRFHLKRILRKTGVARQSELMKLMLSLPGTPNGFKASHGTPSSV